MKFIEHWFSEHWFIGQWSIKKLTLLGFTLVALPLVLALLYSVKQVNHLSKQGSEAIYDVAEFVNMTSELSSILIKMQRFASQYAVLQDKESLDSYSSQAVYIQAFFQSSHLINQDEQLAQLTTSLKQTTLKVQQLLFPVSTEKARSKVTLEQVQSHFQVLSNLNVRINLRSKALINAQASNIRMNAENVSDNILISLLFIPLSLVIASIFFILITKPLRRLTHKIQRLEHGDFTRKIVVSGSTEIKEIAEALDVMRTRLQALELQKSSFIRHISHELKTPLAAIREGTELLYDNSVGVLNSEQQEICHIIRASVSKLQQLIEDLLVFNIVLDSTSLQDSEKLSLTELIQQTVAHHKLDIKRKNITVTSIFIDINLYSNRKQLSVVLDNILSNAIKYSPQHGIISIEAFVKNNQLHLAISDQGIGIRKDQQEKIFDAFYQGVAPIEAPIKSSGLGLTIVKELLMRLNGNIEVCSPVSSKQQGTSMLISLNRASVANIGSQHD